MNHIKGMLILTAALGIATASFAEGNEKGVGKGAIRVAIRNAPGIDEVEVDFDGSVSTDPLDAKSGAQIDVMYVKRFMGADGANAVGGVLGGGVYFSGQSGEDNESEVEISTFGLIGQAGVAWNVADVAVLELLPFIGIGASSVDLTDKTNTFVFESGTGAQIMGGIKGGVYFMIGDNIELGLEAGYTASATGTTIEFPAPLPDATAIFSSGGFQGGAVIAVKF